ncbi:MAG: hypothetical protein QHI48_11140, partial [Bacteroidota bacterium]|nr:hypothetical protein [Bacteroidota bacterium]
MLATIMSTTDGLAFISAAAIGRDILARLSGRSGGGDIRRFTRRGVLLTFAVSIAAAIVFPSVVQLWYVIGTLFIPALLLPLLSTYQERMRLPPSATLLSMGLGFSLSFCSFLWGAFHGGAGSPRYLFGIEPMYLGLAGSAFPYIVHLWKRREPKGSPRGAATGA